MKKVDIYRLILDTKKGLHIFQQNKSGILHQNYFNQLNPQFNSQLFQSQLNARLGINGGSIEKPGLGASHMGSGMNNPLLGSGPGKIEPVDDKKMDNGDDEGPDNPCVELENFQLWNDFHQFGTEMVITKTGR